MLPTVGVLVSPHGVCLNNRHQVDFPLVEVMITSDLTYEADYIPRNVSKHSPGNA